jgi:hypothetical protein
MKLFQGLAAASLFLCAACVSNSPAANNHWSLHSVGPRMSRAFLGYDSNRDGDSYLEFQWERKQDVNRTLRRHFLNDNPENPFRTGKPEEPTPRPVNSPFPEPHRYFHWTLIDGPIATFAEREGADEFWQGFVDLFEPVGVIVGSLLYDGLSLPRAEEQYGASR